MDTQTAGSRLDELAAALRARGLLVRRGTSALAVCLPVRRPPQYLLLEEHEDHTRHWYRAWPGTGRDALLRTEYLGPAEDITRAAGTISRIIGR